MLFKILHGDVSRISTDITPFHEGYCYVTHDGFMYIDMNIGTVEAPNNQRIKLNANLADGLANYDIATVLNSSDTELPTSKAIIDAIGVIKFDMSNQDALVLAEAQKYTNTAIANIEIPEGSVGVTNIVNSESNGGIHQIADNVENGFDFTGKNENATSYDSTLTGTIPYGATGNFASAFGGKSAAIGKRSHAEGTTTIAKGAYSHAEGDNSVTIGADSHAEGYKTTAVGEGSHAEGGRTIAKDKYSHAEGIDTKADGQASHAEGYGTQTYIQYAGNTEIIAAHAEGYLTQARNIGAHSEGVSTISSGEGSHSEGADSEAEGYASHAEGVNTSAIGEGAHSEGNHTCAHGNFSHAEGNNTYAGVNPSGQFFGESAHAEGQNTKAYGYASHTEGVGTEAYGEAQHVQGKYNIDDTDGRYAHIVGNGTSNTEEYASNAHTLDWQGNAWFAGDVYVGGNNQDDGKKLVTEEQFNNIVGSFVKQDAEYINIGKLDTTKSINLTIDSETVSFSTSHMAISTNGSQSGYSIDVNGGEPMSLVFDAVERNLLLVDQKSSGTEVHKIAYQDQLESIKVQPDWNQTDPTQPDYIKNKPSIGGAFTTSIANNVLMLEQIGTQYTTTIENNILTLI